LQQARAKQPDPSRAHTDAQQIVLERNLCVLIGRKVEACAICALTRFGKDVRDEQAVGADLFRVKTLCSDWSL